MKKLFKIFVLMSFIFLLMTNIIYASGIIMDLENAVSNNRIQTQTNNLSSEDTTNNLNVNTTDNSNVDTNEAINSSVNSSPVVTTTSSSTNNDFLNAENILSIFLIVIGILLIFLSIAILIRCK